MRTVEIPVYKFNELDSAAKGAAIQNIRNLGWLWEDVVEFLIERFVEMAAEAGFNDLHPDNIFWDLYSQSQGLYFTGFFDDVSRWVDHDIKDMVDDVSVSIEQRYGMTTCSAKHRTYPTIHDCYGVLNVRVDEIEDTIHKAYVELCQEMFELLESQSMIVYSDEYIAEYLEEQDDEYLHSGEKYWHQDLGVKDE